MVLPVIAPLIANGAVCVVGSQIAEVGPWKTLRRASHDGVQDVGDVVLLPGFINAHCHLDYTDLAGCLSPPKSFPAWIKGLLALRAHWSYSDYAISWLHGARMLLRNGVTTVADVEAVPELLPEVWSATPLRVCSLLELTGVLNPRPPIAILEGALAKIRELPNGTNWAGLSPHAPYSTSPELLHLSAEAARRQHWLLATHVAESVEEYEMYTQSRGALFDWLHTQRSMSDCGQGSPVQHLHRAGMLGRNLLAVHANYLAAGDAALLGQSGCSVVHCPRSHAYFGHRPFPRQELDRAGVNICLGTDSLASVSAATDESPELSPLAEMRTWRKREPGLSCESLLRMATVHGARALGLAGQLGELSPGADADLVTVPFRGKAAEAHEAVVAHDRAVAGVMIRGRWIKDL